MEDLSPALLVAWKGQSVLLALTISQVFLIQNNGKVAYFWGDTY